MDGAASAVDETLGVRAQNQDVAASIGPVGGADSFAILGLSAYAALRMMPIVNQTTLSINKIRFGSAAVDTVQPDSERGSQAAPFM